MDPPCETSHRGPSNQELRLVFFLSFICLIYLHDREAKPIDLERKEAHNQNEWKRPSGIDFIY